MNSDPRQALWDALVDLAPRGTPRTWQGLARAVPKDAAPAPELIERLSTSPPHAAQVSTEWLAQAAHAAQQHRDAERSRQQHQSIRLQAGPIAGIAVGIWIAASAALAGMRLFEPIDLAANKPWRASSMWGAVPCDPEHGVCGPLRSRIFFHTQDDESPWVEFDLLSPQTFSAATINNRRDENLEARAVPLVLEVSDDRATWREIARRDEVFTSWKPTFAPTTARYVRARIARRSWLHLEAMRIHP